MTQTLLGKIRLPQATLTLGGASHSMLLLWSAALSAICFFFSISLDSSVVSSSSCLHQGGLLADSFLRYRRFTYDHPLLVFGYWYRKWFRYLIICAAFHISPSSPNFVQPDQFEL